MLQKTRGATVSESILLYHHSGIIPIYIEGAFDFNAIYDHINRDKVRIFKFDGKEDVIKSVDSVKSIENFKFAAMIDSDFDRLDTQQHKIPNLVRTEFHDIFSEWILNNQHVLRSLIASNSQRYNKDISDDSRALDINEVLRNSLFIAYAITQWKIINIRNENQIRFKEKEFNQIKTPSMAFEEIRDILIKKSLNKDSTLDPEFLYLETSGPPEDIQGSSLEKFIGDHDLLNSLKRSLEIYGVKSPNVSNESLITGLNCQVINSSITIRRINEIIDDKIFRCTFDDSSKGEIPAPAN